MMMMMIKFVNLHLVYSCCCKVSKNTLCPCRLPLACLCTGCGLAGIFLIITIKMIKAVNIERYIWFPAGLSEVILRVIEQMLRCYVLFVRNLITSSSTVLLLRLSFTVFPWFTGGGGSHWHWMSAHHQIHPPSPPSSCLQLQLLLLTASTTNSQPYHSSSTSIFIVFSNDDDDDDDDDDDVAACCYRPPDRSIILMSIFVRNYYRGVSDGTGLLCGQLLPSLVWHKHKHKKTHIWAVLLNYNSSC